MIEHKNHEQKLKSMKNYNLYKDMVEKYPEIEKRLKIVSKYYEDFFEQLDEYLPFIAEEYPDRSLKKFLEFLMQYEATEEAHDQLYNLCEIFVYIISNLKLYY